MKIVEIIISLFLDFYGQMFFIKINNNKIKYLNFFKDFYYYYLPIN